MSSLLKRFAAGVSAVALTGSGLAYAQSDGDADGESQDIDTIDVIGTLADHNSVSALPVQVLSGDALANRRQGGLGETLAGLPGVHLDSFGAGASRPVIRGQTVPRIEVLSDGANMFDVSSVSPDHAIASEPLLLDGIEVLRGPAAALYGGNALNGAVNLIDGKVPTALPESGLSGGWEARYGTGDNERAFAGRATAGGGPFAIHVEGFTRTSDNYAVPEAFGSDELTDSYAEGAGYAIGASWITSKGHIGAAYSRQDGEYGLPGHSHSNAVCHTHGADLHCEAHDEFSDPYQSSDGHTAYINLRSDRVDVRADYDDLLPGISHARMRLSYTDYQHNEIDGPILFSEYTNEVYDGRVELTHAPFFGFTGTFGTQYTDGTFAGLDSNLIVDNTQITELYIALTRYAPPVETKTENRAIFLSESRAFGPVDVEFAIRKDWREVTRPVPEIEEFVRPGFEILLPLFVSLYGEDWIGQFREPAAARYAGDNPDVETDTLSASFGATWNLDRGRAVAVSLAHSERAPSVRELYAYGNNLATNSYEVGLTQTTRASSGFPEISTDVIEKSDTINLTFRDTEGPTRFEIGIFHQDVENYIFARHIETEYATGIPHNYLVYVAADARFTGIDGQVSHRLSPESTLVVFGDYVHADLTDEDDNLPRIPPARLGARYEWESGPVFAELEYYRTFEQDRVAVYESETDGYDMVNATLTYRLGAGSSHPTELFLRATNLTDELAYVHTSFVKAQSPLRGRNFVMGARMTF